MQMPSLLRLQQAVDDTPPLLRVSLDVDYANKPGALRGVSFTVRRGEVLGLIGESGSGKSTVALAVLRLLRRTAHVRGSIEFDGRDLIGSSEGELRKIRGREIGLVLQSPLASLNPVLRIGTQLAEAWAAHRRTPRQETRARLLHVLDLVSLPANDDFLSRYPRQLSVGLAQRVLIAMAILHEPKLLIADEPMSALDVITGAEILQLFARLNRELNMAILFISHDLLSVASLCGRVAIMRSGEIVESAPTIRIFRDPRHEYTRALVAALPRLPEGFANTAATTPSPLQTAPP
jgi:ABC-type dipeptide/oligopeptide/nickel transport system ATPase component